MIDPLDKEYQSFLDESKVCPPQALDIKITSFIKNDMNPEHKVVFIKLLTVQAFIGLLTLLFCPQFQLSLTNNHKIFHYFHHTFGALSCFAFCGALFVGSGAIFASYTLKASEIRKVRSNRTLYYLFVSIVAMSSFLLFGAETYLTAIASWLIGAILSGMLMFEISTFLRGSISTYQR